MNVFEHGIVNVSDLIAEVLLNLSTSGNVFDSTGR